MENIERIIDTIDEFLNRKHLKITNPVEINPYLEAKGLLKDSKSRPGAPIRRLLRANYIPHAYQIGVRWYIPHSTKFLKPTTPIPNIKEEVKSQNKSFNKNNKLKPIGDLILNLLEKKYNKRPSCYYEYKPEWLLSNPSHQVIKNRPELSSLYRVLTGNHFPLKERIYNLSEKQINQKQSFDIWIGEPFNFAVEFDEKQHFNQFRKISLNYYDQILIRFPLELYVILNKGIVIKPGTSGFTRLKSYDALFPEMLMGEPQDNRIRQRAFRDYLKDLLPIEHGFNPTLRIPCNVTNGNIKDFTEFDLQNIEEYISEYNLI